MCNTQKSIVFTLKYQKNTSLLTFYAAYPNFQTMMALFEFLDPSTNKGNINYYLPGRETFKSNSDSEKIGK